MTGRQTTRNPRAAGTEAQQAEAERQRQEALKAEKMARGSAAPEPKAEPEAPADTPPPAKRRAPAAKTADPKPKAKRAPKPKAEAEPVAAAPDAKAEMAAKYAHIGTGSAPEDRHAAVKALAESGLFNYAEIARLTGYANGGVVRNLVIPPERNRSKYEPLADDALAKVRTLEAELGLSIRDIAKRTPKAEA